MNNRIGLGDVAYWAFRPGVYFVDAVWGTDLRHCDVCRLRRERWNNWLSVPVWLSLIFTVTISGAIIWWRA